MALERITFGDNIPGFIGGPKGRPGVVVLQEWWGVNEEVKRQATHILNSGNYRVLIPDLYKGKLGLSAAEAHHLMDNLNWPNAVKEITQAIKYLKTDGSPKVATVGFCMGGGLALLGAEHGGADAAVSFYGKPDPRMGNPKNIKVPVQAHSGTEDAFKGFADPPTVRPWIAEVPGNKGEFYEYPGEGHGFMNGAEDIHNLMKASGMPIGSKASQDTAWGRVFPFLKKNIG